MRKNEAKRSLEKFDERTRWIHSLAVAVGENKTLPNINNLGNANGTILQLMPSKSAKILGTGAQQLITRRSCGCGCGKTFIPTKYNQRYLNKTHYSRAKWRRYCKKHNVHKEYQGMILCPKCGYKGELFHKIRDNGIVMGRFAHHKKKVYSPHKYRKWRQQGLTSKEANKKTRTITKHVRDCWI